MICKHCGAEIAEGAKFCTSCGESLENIGSENNSVIEEKATLISNDQEENSADNVLNSIDSTEEVGALENSELPLTAESTLESESGNSVLTAEPTFESKGGNSVLTAESTFESESDSSPLTAEPSVQSVGSEEDSGTSSEKSESPYFPPGAGASNAQYTKQEQPVYIPPVMVTPKAKRKKAGKGKTALISILLGIFIFIFTFATECLILTNITFSKRNISRAAADINPADTKIGALLEMESVKAALEEEGVKTESFNADTTLGEFLAALSLDFPMSGEDITQLFEETDIMEEFSAIAADYEKYLLTGEGGDYLSSKKVLSIIENHKADILKYTGVDISEYSDKIEATVDELKSDIKDLNPENSLGGFGRIAYIFLSPAAIIVIAAFALFFTILIMTVTKRPFAGILTLGISCALSGLICFVTALFHSLFLSAFMPKGTEIDKVLSKLFKESLFDDMLKISLVFLGFGAFLIVIKIIQNAVVKKFSKV